MTDHHEAIAYMLLKQDIEEFLYHEVEPLDERRYEEWLELLADDVRYWMPMRRNVRFGELEREFTREGLDIDWFDEGNTPVFTCPYHGWSYASDGKLVGVPYFKEAYHGKLDKSQWRLVEVAQLCNYKGTIWATWAASGRPFLEYLGDFKLYLDLSLDAWDGRKGGSEVLGGIQKWLIPCNWKFPAENFSGDGVGGSQGG